MRGTPKQADAHKAFTFPRQRGAPRPKQQKYLSPQGSHRPDPGEGAASLRPHGKTRRMWTCPPCLLHLRPLFKASAAKPGSSRIITLPNQLVPDHTFPSQQYLDFPAPPPLSPATQHHHLHPPRIQFMSDLHPRPWAPHAWSPYPCPPASKAAGCRMPLGSRTRWVPGARLIKTTVVLTAPCRVPGTFPPLEPLSRHQAAEPFVFCCLSLSLLIGS